MDIREINKLQNILFDQLEPVYNKQGFKADRKNWLFIGPETRFELYVDTKIGDFYTLRPGIEIYKQDILKEINRLINISGKSIRTCGHFFLCHKLAESFGIDKYSKCKENDYGKNQVFFRHKISSETDVQEVFLRHQEILQDFGWKTYSLAKDHDSLKKSLENHFNRFYESFKAYPNKRITERPLRLTFESYLTMTLLLCRNSIQNAVELVNKTTELFGVESKIVNSMRLIIKEYR